MIETKTHPEIAQLQITSEEVFSAFENLQNQVIRGFRTSNQRLGEYARFFHTLSSYFNQPHVEQLPQTKDLVNTLFYNHQIIAQYPLDFFEQTLTYLESEDLRLETIAKNPKDYKDAFVVIKNSVLNELGRATLTFNQENAEKKKLDNLVLRADVKPFEQTSTETEKRKQEIQANTIRLLADTDPEIAQELVKKDACLAAITAVLNKPSIDSDELDVLQSYGDFLPLDDLKLRASFGQTELIKRDLINIVQKLENPDFTWKQLLTKESIPRSLLDSFDEVITFSELNDKVIQTQGMDKSQKAGILYPFLEKGVTASMLMEIIEEKFEFSDDFLANQIDAFLHMYDEVQKIMPEKEQPISKEWKARSLKRKIIAAAMLGMLATTPFACNELSQIGTLPFDQIKREAEAQTPDITFPKYLDKQEPSNISWSGGRRQKLEKTTNDSAETFKQANATVVWELSDSNLLGLNLAGYYRTSTATHFVKDNDGFGWPVEITPKVANPVSFIPGKDITITRKMNVTENDVVDLPVKTGYEVTEQSINAQVKNSPFTIPLSSYLYTRQVRDGTYFTEYISNSGQPTEITFSYGIGKSDTSQTPIPDNHELERMKYPLVDKYLLPKEVQQFLKDLEKRNLTDLDKAKIIQKYIQKTFYYSLDTKASDYYQIASNEKDFILRVFELKKTDCDVANTALIALLRSQGIPSRMVFGFANSGNLDSDAKNLKASEYHGWTEAFINGKWVTLDATPTQMDEYTEKALAEVELPGVHYALTPSEWLQALSSLEYGWNKLRLDLGLFYQLIELVLLGLAGAGADYLLRKNNDKRADDLIQKVKDRLSKHFGNSYPDIHKYIAFREQRTIEEKMDDSSKFSFVPVLGFLRLLPLTLHRFKLEQLPYEKTSAHPKPLTDIPDVAKITSEVLGYRKKDLEQGMFDDALRLVSGKVDADMYNRISGFFSNPKTSVGSKKIRTYTLSRILRMKKPQGQTPLEIHENWRMERVRAIDDVYKKYLKAWKKHEKKQRRSIMKRKKRHTEKEIPSEDKFRTMLEPLFTLKLLHFSAEDAHEAALKSLTS